MVVNDRIFDDFIGSCVWQTRRTSISFFDVLQISLNCKICLQSCRNLQYSEFEPLIKFNEPRLVQTMFKDIILSKWLKIVVKTGT